MRFVISVLRIFLSLLCRIGFLLLMSKVIYVHWRVQKNCRRIRLYFNDDEISGYERSEWRTDHRQKSIMKCVYIYILNSSIRFVKWETCTERVDIRKIRQLGTSLAREEYDHCSQHVTWSHVDRLRSLLLKTRQLTFDIRWNVGWRYVHFDSDSNVVVHTRLGSYCCRQVRKVCVGDFRHEVHLHSEMYVVS